MRKLTAALALLSLVAVSCETHRTKADRLVENYAVVEIPAPDLSGITDNGKEVLNLYRFAADEVDKIYWKQNFGDKEALLSSLTDPAARLYAEINYGPWDRIDGKPFVEGYGAKPAGSCFYPADMTADEFEADPNNIALLKKITGIMIKKGCTEDNPLFFDATEKLYELEPSPSTAMRMGQMCWSKKQYGKAVEYVQDALKSLTDKKDRYRAYIILGLSYSGQGSYSAARTAFLNAAETDRTKGEPYLQLAQAYAKSSRSIDDGMGGRSAYWAAVDELRHAKQVEPTDEIISFADKLISSYSSYFPKKNDAFMLDLIDGHSYTVPGWIGRSTIIRTR